MQDEIERLRIMLNTLKIVAHSVYGCLCFETSRFYSKDIAAMMDFYDRNLLKKTVELAKQMKFDVLYGDLDRLLLNSRQKELKEAL